MNDVSSPKVAVIRCGVGNLLCVRSALNRLGAESFEADRGRDFARADAVIMPGVGAFPAAMRSLAQLDMLGPLREHVLEGKKPFLGICLGMQLLAEDSEEFGPCRGLGWLAGNVVRLPDRGLRLPHVGWNTVEERDPVMFARIPEDAHFYFDHTYHFACAPGPRAGSSSYGQAFVAAVRRGNLWGTQFHPEKSQLYGLMLLRNFLNMVKETVPC